VIAIFLPYFIIEFSVSDLFPAMCKVFNDIQFNPIKGCFETGGIQHEIM